VDEDDRVKCLLSAMCGCPPEPEETASFTLPPNSDPPELYQKLNDRIRENGFLKRYLPLLILIWIEEERYPVDSKEEDLVLQIAEAMLIFSLGKSSELPKSADPTIHNSLAFYTKTRLKYELSWFWLAETVPLLEKLRKDLKLLDEDEGAFQQQLGGILGRCEVLVQRKGCSLEDIYALFVVGIHEAVAGAGKAGRIGGQLEQVLRAYQPRYGEDENIKEIKLMAKELAAKFKS